MTSSDSMQSFRTTEEDKFPDIDYYNIRKASIVLRALNHRLRQQIIKIIHENKILTVTQLYNTEARTNSSITASRYFKNSRNCIY